jgi:hypothetical protein
MMCCPYYPYLEALNITTKKLLNYTPTLLPQDFAYSYRVWIILIKHPRGPLQHARIGTDIHQGERLYGRLLPSLRRVSENEGSRKLGE